jgi:microcystin-dependent protein
MGQPFTGEIRMFGGNFAPQGWALCNGQLQSIAQNPALFQLIGTTYGGDGVNTFGLPDMQCRIPVHRGSGFVQGQRAGEENHTLTAGELPSHIHVVNAKTEFTSGSPGGNVFAGGGSEVYKAGPPGGTMNPGVVQQNGGGQPHGNLMPSLAITFIIALEGVFPQSG